MSLSLPQEKHEENSEEAPIANVFEKKREEKSNSRYYNLLIVGHKKKNKLCQCFLLLNGDLVFPFHGQPPKKKEVEYNWS